MTRYAMGYEEITVASTAVGFTSAKYGSAKRARVQVSGGPVRVRVDGTDPTTEAGELFYPGDIFIVAGSLSSFSAIQAASDEAVLRVTYDTVVPAESATIERRESSDRAAKVCELSFQSVGEG